MKTDIIIRMNDGKLHVFQNVISWSDYKDKHESIEVRYLKSKIPKKFKKKEVLYLIVMTDRCVMTWNFND